MHQHSAEARPSPRWPTGHIGWAYVGLPEFEGRVASFLAEGHGRRERQFFIADDPQAGRWPKDLVARGDLVVLSTAEIYGPARIVDPAAQLDAFTALLAQARDLGYTGLRVAADNTSLTRRPEQLEAWLRCEPVADRFMRENPVTGICAFDRTRSDASTLEAVMHAHPATAPPPPSTALNRKDPEP